MPSAVSKVCFGEVQDYLDSFQLLCLRFETEMNNKLTSRYLANTVKNTLLIMDYICAYRDRAKNTVPRCHRSANL